jgi:hypothetical protein
MFPKLIRQRQFARWAREEVAAAGRILGVSGDSDWCFLFWKIAENVLA